MVSTSTTTIRNSSKHTGIVAVTSMVRRLLFYLVLFPVLSTSSSRTTNSSSSDGASVVFTIAKNDDNIAHQQERQRQEEEEEEERLIPLYDLVDRVLGLNNSSSNNLFDLSLCDDDGTTSRSSSRSKDECDLCTKYGGNSGGSDNDTHIPYSNSNNNKKDQFFCIFLSAKTRKNVTSMMVDPIRTNMMIHIVGTSIPDISYGIGFYLRYYCNYTLGWDRVGGSVRNLLQFYNGDGGSGNDSDKCLQVAPQQQKQQQDEATEHSDEDDYIDNRSTTRQLEVLKYGKRHVPYSYFMNVCTNSYSLVWHDWNRWEEYIDWLSLMGINNILALTGQEEIQYKVFTQLGLNDSEIRSWFNGPSFLTWSRGQNEYGNNICGMLPRSFMKNQWLLQKDYILPRLRQLEIYGQLPGFQGNVPKQLTKFYPDSTISIQGDTGWLDAMDPLYTKIANKWMEILIQDFGDPSSRNRDNWYQLDGYLNGNVPPWILNRHDSNDGSDQPVDEISTMTSKMTMTPSSEMRLLSSQSQNTTSTSDIIHDELWYRRGVAAYQGLNRSDPNGAVWSFQGFSFISWNTSEITASWLKGFVDSVRDNDDEDSEESGSINNGKFVIIDMSYQGLGEWTKWTKYTSNYFNTSFIWTALHNFGNTNGIKGDLSRIYGLITNVLNTSSTLVGIGGTPEGIDQNPAFYEFLFDANFCGNATKNDTIMSESTKDAVASILVERSHRRYHYYFKDLAKNHAARGGINGMAVDRHAGMTYDWKDSTKKAWELLSQSSYANDQSTRDMTGVTRFRPLSDGMFESDRFTPKPFLCDIFHAWEHMIDAAARPYAGNHQETPDTSSPFTYDLINLGREVLAQLSTPVALNFSDTINGIPLNDTNRIIQTGDLYLELLNDLDRLVASDTAFLLGPWIETARSWGLKSVMNESHGTNGSKDGEDMYIDCNSTSVIPSGVIQDCPHFYEWNARVQVTTWNPVLSPDAKEIPGGPIDYAGKHWSGLILDYYVARISILLRQALVDARSSKALNKTRVSQLLAHHAYQWTTSQKKYPVQATGDPVQISILMHRKYSPWFDACGTSVT